MQIVTPPGNPVGLWRPTVECAPHRSIASLTSTPGNLLVLSAHPDDETLGAGRLIAGWARSRGEVVAVSMSAGEACLDHLAIQISGLGELRRTEFSQATAELGVRRARCWSLTDGKVGEQLPAVMDDLGALIDGAVAVAAPWRFDPHPDHAALGLAAASICSSAAIPLLEYPIWSSFWHHPSELDAHGYQAIVIETEPLDTDARDRAVSRYGSQILPLRWDLTPVVPKAMLAHHNQQLLFVTNAAAQP